MWKRFDEYIRGRSKRVGAILALGIVVDAVLLIGLFAARASAGLYFLPVGQGDSEMIVLQSGAKILLDGGPPGGAVLNSLDAILGPRDRYLDIVILTHPQLDHYGGLIDVLQRYDVGVFVSNGMTSDVPAYGDLAKALLDDGVRTVALQAGDTVRVGDGTLAVDWPSTAALQAGDLNLAAIVIEYSGGGMQALFTSDIDAKTEQAILPTLGGPANVLKVAHHGSKYSSSPELLAAVRPQVAVIEVGKNSYGHPASEALARLKDAGALVFRTDEDGLIKISASGGRLDISKLSVQ